MRGSENAIKFWAPKLLPHAQISPHLQLSYIFHERISRTEYAFKVTVFLLQCYLAKNYRDSTSLHAAARGLRLTVAVFVCTFALTALLLKIFHLRLISDAQRTLVAW